MKKELRPVHELQSCDVCGRTILKGERTEVYLAPGGQRYSVCELCFARAEQSGWLRESAHGDVPARLPKAEPRRPLIGRLMRKGARAEPEPAPVGGLGPGEGHQAVEETQPAELGDADAPETHETEPEPGVPSESPRRRERPKDPRHVRAVPTTAEGKVERALDLFNASEYQRTVAGLARSLGGPWVTAVADLEASSMVTVVVAWELSWYRYRVDLGDGRHPVALQDKGEELGQIDSTLREWNAGLDDRGHLVVGVPQQ